MQLSGPRIRLSPAILWFLITALSLPAWSAEKMRLPGRPLVFVQVTGSVYQVRFKPGCSLALRKPHTFRAIDCPAINNWCSGFF